MYLRIIAAFALSFIFYSGSSQDSYHRLYETNFNNPSGTGDTIFYHMSSTTQTGVVYAFGTKRSVDDEHNLSLVFTKHDNKGDISWSREIDLGVDTVVLRSNGMMEFNGSGDSLLFTIDALIEGEAAEFFGRMDLSGNGAEIFAVKGTTLSGINNNPNVAPFINSSDLFVTSNGNPVISRLGMSSEVLWSNSYEFTNSGGNAIQRSIFDINPTLDSTIIITGITQALDTFMLAELDSNGVQVWAESYTFSVPGLTEIIPFEVVPLQGGNFAVAGQYNDVTSAKGFVAIVDTSGSVVLAQSLNLPDSETIIRNIIEGADGSLWLSGTYNDSDSIKYFTANMDVAGTINWTTVYGDELGILDAFTTSLLRVDATGGATLVGHGFIDDLQVLQVMKHDMTGKAFCSDSTSMITESIAVVEDTLTSTFASSGLFLDSLNFELMNFSNFTPPTLSVTQYPPFCPNVFIDTFLVASVSGVAEENLAYLWSTGETNDTIFFVAQPMEEPEFSVTVTVSEDVCYEMCDTVQITRILVPQIDIIQDISRFCSEGIIVLNANYTPGASNETYLWNTGETTSSIEVTEAGTYSVTVTDDCNEMAMDQLDLELPNITPSVSITQQGCRLIASYVGFGIQPEFVWSTNETTDTILISPGATYSVSVTDECGEMASDQIEITEFDPVLFGDVGQLDCATGTAIISTAYADGGNFPEFMWSTGETSSIITVTENGTYDLTVTDECGIIEEYSQVVNIFYDPEVDISAECDLDIDGNNTVVFSYNPGVFDGTLVVFQNFGDGMDSLVSQIENPTSPLPIGSYTAYVSQCGLLLDSLQILPTYCGEFLSFPIAFFPQGQDEVSRRFGPIPNDSMNVDLITNVEFKVFNRWGETVFESNDIYEAWDGRHKDEPAPSEVYIWYITYMLEGEEIVEKGDVTLIR